MKEINKFNVFDDKKSRRLIYTKNLTPGKSFFSEELVREGGTEYRSWDVSRSKLGASIKKGASQIGIKDRDLVTKQVDDVYQDIAQKNQVEIFLKNCDAFLKKGGFGLLAVKARSVDVTKHPKEIFREVRRQLEQSSMVIVDYRELEPFERDHAFLLRG